MTAASSIAATRTRCSSQSVGDATVAVVCDGVSTSIAPQVAAQAGASTAGGVISAALNQEDVPWHAEQVLVEALTAANGAVVDVPWAQECGCEGPSCTIVAAVWDGQTITVAWSGDSRAYWVGEADAAQLTSDHSWAQCQIDAGLAVPHEALADPRAHAITRWLGPDAPDETAPVALFRPLGAGRLVLCTDGLWNYLESVDDLSAKVHDAGRHGIAAGARPRSDAVRTRSRRARQHHCRRRRHRTRTLIQRGALIVIAFMATTDQNEYLPIGGDRVDAIVTVTATGTGPRSAGADGAAVMLVLDGSGSMRPRVKWNALKKAASAAISQIRDDVAFGVIIGSEEAHVIYPRTSGLAKASNATRAEAMAAIEQERADGGTAIGRWLLEACERLAPYERSVRHAILLTDGQDQHETPEELRAAVRSCAGVFQCDCRGVGTDWRVDELRSIASELLGTVDLVARPDDMPADFEAMMRRAMGKRTADVCLRLWTPRGATVKFVKQVSPTIEDLTDAGIDHRRAHGRLPDRHVGRRGS